MNFVALDIETAPVGDAPQEYALQPWRVLEGTAKITAIGISTASTALVHDKNFDVLMDATARHSFLTDTYYATWNGVFDVAYLIAAGYDVRKVKWVDVMLLWKWYSNSQRMEWQPSWSLVAGAERWLQGWPLLDKFLAMKAAEPAAGENDQYWKLRCKFDAIVTRLITEKIWPLLTSQQQRSALIEAACIWPVANSWVKGVKIALDLINELMPAVTVELLEIETALGLVNDSLNKKQKIYGVEGVDWQPSKILRSPKQKAVLLYETWGLICTMWTDKEARSTSKAALTYLADFDDRMLELLRWSELNTQLTKFLNSPSEAAEYLGSDVLHPSPKLFSTYSGRMTYQSKIKKKFKTGLAIHQMPRPKQIRRMVIV